MRLKVQTIKTLVWLGCALAGAAILGLLVWIFIRVVPVIKDTDRQRSKAREAAVNKMLKVEPTIKARQHAAVINGNDTIILHQLNITGRDPPPPVEVKTDDLDGAPPPIQPIEEVLYVKTVIAKSDPSGSFATIQYKADPPTPPAPPPSASDPTKTDLERHHPKQLEGWLQVGQKLRDPYDKLPFNGRVIRIDESGVEFEWGGASVTLGPKELSGTVGQVKLFPDMKDMFDPAFPPAPPVDPEAPPVEAPNTAESVALNPSDWYIGTDELARIEKEGEDLLKEIEFGSVKVAAEKRMRVTLKKVPEGTLAYQRGFRDGDVLRSINGEDVISNSTIIQNVRKNDRASTFTVELERRGSRVTKVFKLAR